VNVTDADAGAEAGPSEAGRLTAALLHGAGRVPGASLFTRVHARVFRRSAGRIGRRWFGAPVLVLEVRGRRTGKTRATSVIYLSVDNGYVVTPANAGNDRMPQWWLNLRAAGSGIVYLEKRREVVVARQLDGDERDARWTELVAAYPSVAHYRRYTDRAFPVIALERVVGETT
jgi:deazaflavin-dependent oxidoreductase (nitroreductase family)